MAIIRTINAANRAVGTTTFGGDVVPAGSVGRFQITITATQAVLDDLVTDFDLWVEISSDGVTWRRDAFIRFIGRPNLGKGGTVTPPPGFSVNIAEYAGLQVRAVLIVRNQTTRLGAVIESL